MRETTPLRPSTSAKFPPELGFYHARFTPPAIPGRLTPPPIAGHELCDTFWTNVIPCQRPGFNVLTAELVLVVMLLVPHVSVVVFIIAHGSRNKDFRQAFFVQFAVVSTVDCLRMAMVGGNLIHSR